MLMHIPVKYRGPTLHQVFWYFDQTAWFWT